MDEKELIDQNNRLLVQYSLNEVFKLTIRASDNPQINGDNSRFAIFILRIGHITLNQFLSPFFENFG